MRSGRGDPAEFVLKEGLVALERTVSADNPHVELPLLAAYLDGQVGQAARDQIEGHFASCRQCRLLASETALALRQTRGPWQALKEWAVGLATWRPSRSWYPAFAAASVLLVIGILTNPLDRKGARHHDVAGAGHDSKVSDASGPSRAPIVEAPDAATARQIAASDPEMRARLDLVRGGHLPQVTGFETFLDPARTQLRGEGTRPAAGARAPVCGGEQLPDLAPRPLVPRCSVILGNRPRFLWLPRPRAVQQRTDYVITLLDADERFVGELHDSLPSTSDPSLPLQVSFPQNQPPLKAGRAYSWKVTAMVDGREDRSIYVPFRIAAQAEVSTLENELSRAGDNLYLKAVVFAWHGFYEEALSTLSGTPKDPASQERARSLAAFILQRKGLPATD